MPRPRHAPRGSSSAAPGHALWREARGGGLVSYLIAVGGVALLATAGWFHLGRSLRATSERQGACVFHLDPSCPEPEGGSARGASLEARAKKESVTPVALAGGPGQESREERLERCGRVHDNLRAFDADCAKHTEERYRLAKSLEEDLKRLQDLRAQIGTPLPSPPPCALVELLPTWARRRHPWVIAVEVACVLIEIRQSFPPGVQRQIDELTAEIERKLRELARLESQMRVTQQNMHDSWPRLGDCPLGYVPIGARRSCNPDLKPY